jgi:drug/metabolite transporter (DMT)-like permease
MATVGSSKNLALGILLIVAAFFCVAVMSAFGKAAAALPTSVISFFQSFISLVVFLPWVLRGGTGEMRTGRLPVHVLAPWPASYHRCCTSGR